MSRIHKEHLQAGYIFGDTVNQEYIYLPSGEGGTVHMIDTLTLKRCSHPTLGKKSF